MIGGIFCNSKFSRETAEFARPQFQSWQLGKSPYRDAGDVRSLEPESSASKLYRSSA